MRINGTSTQMSGMNVTQASDSVSKNIQNRIANAQKQLKELSANKDMSVEEKMKRRQEIQQQIADLNNQLRQHQMEQRKEKQQKKDSSVNDMLGNNKKTVSKVGNSKVGLSQASMKAMISADSTMAQAQVQGNVSARMEGRAGVLESEIKMDMARGDDVEAKQEELVEVQKKAVAAESAQMNALADANKVLEEAVKAEQKEEKTNEKDNVFVGKQSEKVADINKSELSVLEESGEVKNTEVVTEKDVDGMTLAKMTVYSHVDLRL